MKYLAPYPYNLSSCKLYVTIIFEIKTVSSAVVLVYEFPISLTPSQTPNMESSVVQSAIAGLAPTYCTKRSTCALKSGTFVEYGCTRVELVVAPPYAKFQHNVSLVLWVPTK